MSKKFYASIMLIICTTLAFAASSVAPNVGLTWLSNADPTVLPGVNAPLDQFLIRTDSPSIYYKSGPGPTQWTLIGSDGSSSGFVPSSRAINTVAPIQGGGTLAMDLTLSMATNGITNALFRQSTATSVVGRSANSTGNVADITAGADNTVLGRTGGALSFFDPATIPSIVPSTRTISTTAPIAGGGNLSADRTFSLNANGITNALFRQSGATSVVGNSTNGTANVADISASLDGTVLARSSGALSFVDPATIPSIVPSTRTITAGTGLTGGGDLSANRTISVASNGITNALFRQSAAVSVVANSTGSTANVADLTASADGQVLQRAGGVLVFATIAAASLPAFSGDVTTSAGSTVTTIAANAVTNAKFRQSAGTSVVGNATGSTANVADITASADNTVLARTSGALSFISVGSVLPGSGLFGTGIDGSFTFDGSTTFTAYNGTTVVPSGNVYTLNEDIFLTVGVVNNGVTIKVNCFRIFASQSFTVNGTVQSDGNPGGNGTNGGGQSAGGQAPCTGSEYLARAPNGGNGGGSSFGAGVQGGQINPYAFGYTHSGGAAGANGTFPAAGGGGGTGGGTAQAGGAVTATSANARGIHYASQLILMSSPPNGAGVICGGSGGGGGGGSSGGSAGAGGSGGSCVLIIAKSIGGSGSITARGGAGGTGISNSGGGGGGGGGGVVIISQAGTAPTLDVSGGAAGAGQGTGTNGGSGAAGISFNLQQ